MSKKFYTVRRYNARSFLQISLDQTEEASIAEQLRDVRRISRALAPIVNTPFLQSLQLHKMGNIRRKDNRIILFVNSAAQHSKLRQLLPRISDAIAKAGYRDPVDIRIRAQKMPIEMRENRALGQPRQGSEAGAQALLQSTERMQESELKTQLLKLAQTLKKTAPNPS